MTPVYLECPACGYAWFYALIDPSAWWGKGVTPQSLAQQPYCERCEQAPPMRVAGSETQPRLWERAS
jgi:hypothetical protein